MTAILVIAIVLVLWASLAGALVAWLILPAPPIEKPRELQGLSKRLAKPPPASAPPQSPATPTKSHRS